MPRYLAERVIVTKLIASPADANGEYIEMVFAPPGTAGAFPVRERTDEYVFWEGILRPDIASCEGDFIYVYDEITKGPPGSGITITWVSAPNQRVNSGASVTLQWTVTVETGLITKAEVLENGVFLANAVDDGGGAYSYVYSGADGQHYVQLQITTDEPAGTVSSRHYHVFANLPAISWQQNPTPNQIWPPNTSTMIWNVTAPAGIASVKVLRDDAAIGNATDEGGGKWQHIQGAFPLGSFTYKGRVQDIYGAVAETSGQSLEILAEQPPVPDTAYLLRWYGAGVADQQFSDGQVLQFPEEGMLDGDLYVNWPIPAADSTPAVNGEALSIISTGGNIDTAFASNTNLFGSFTNYQGMTYWYKQHPDTNFGWIWNIRGGVGHNTVPGGGSNLEDIYSYTGTNARLYNNASLLLPSENEVDQAYGITFGGFNAVGEPSATGEGEQGVFKFSKTASGQVKLEYVNAARFSLLTDVAHPNFRGALTGAGDLKAEYMVVPDADLSSMLTPVVMDTFNRANGPLGDADVGGSWIEYLDDSGGSIGISANQLSMEASTPTYAASNHAVMNSGLSDFVMRYITEGTANADTILRRVDAANYMMIKRWSSSIVIAEVVMGSYNALATLSETPAISDINIVIADGDTITYVRNDTAVINAPSITNGLLGTEHGFRPGQSGLSFLYDNFSVYPRRSTSQYDDVIQPYIDNLGVVAPSNPAKPKYAWLFDPSGVADVELPSVSNTLLGEEYGFLVGQGTTANNASVAAGRIENGVLRGVGNGGNNIFVWSAEDTLFDANPSRVLIADFEHTEYLNSPSYIRTGLVDSHWQNAPNIRAGIEFSWQTAEVMEYADNNKSVLVPASKIRDSNRAQVAVVGGAFSSAGEPSDGTQQEQGYIYLVKTDTGGQYELAYISAVAPAYASGVKKINMCATAPSPDKGIKRFSTAVTYDPLPQLLTPTVLDKLTGTADELLVGRVPEVGTAWLQHGAVPSSPHQLNDVGDHALIRGGGTAAKDRPGIYQDCNLNDVVLRLTTPDSSVNPGWIMGNNQGVLLRRVDDNNFNRVWWNSSTSAWNIGEVNLGVASTFATSGTLAPITGVNPLTVIADGDSITTVWQDSVVETATAIPVLTGTGVGMLMATGSGTGRWKNLQVLPRRSYSQYDEVLNSYVPGYDLESKLVVHDVFDDADGSLVAGRLPKIVNTGQAWQNGNYTLRTGASNDPNAGSATSHDLTWLDVTYSAMLIKCAFNHSGAPSFYIGPGIAPGRYLQITNLDVTAVNGTPNKHTLSTPLVADQLVEITLYVRNRGDGNTDAQLQINGDVFTFVWTNEISRMMLYYFANNTRGYRWVKVYDLS